MKKPIEIDSKMQEILEYLKAGLSYSEIVLKCREKWKGAENVVHIVDSKYNQLIKKGLWKP